MTPELSRALSFWTLGIQYLHLAQSSANLIVESGNKYMMFFEGADWEEQDQQFREATRWTDHNLGVPVLFSFYHGLELVLKGLLAAHGQHNAQHKLSELHRHAARLCPNGEFLPYVQKYTNADSLPAIVRTFIEESGAGVDDWYQAFKYPDNVKGIPFRHHYLMYQDDAGVAMFDGLAKDIDGLRRTLVAHARASYGVP